MNKPIHINEASFEQVVLQSPVPVLVDFWAPWCGPCQMISPILDEIAVEGGDRFQIAKVNVDDEPALAQRFSIRGIPALLFFSGGQLQHQISGTTRKQVILDKLEELAAASLKA
jgi:thioredoxin 1